MSRQNADDPWSVFNQLHGEFLFKSNSGILPLSHKDYGIISLMGLLDMWRINIIEKTWPSVYCFIFISIFFVCLRVLVAE